MSKEKKKKKFPWRALIIIPLFLGASFALGWFFGKKLTPILKELPPEKIVLTLIVFYVCLFLFPLLQTAAHEAGHLICGLLSGYQYSSFRIGSFMWVKLDGKIRFKRYSLAGTGGQCLMAPPDKVEGKFPYALYLSGGCLANAIVSVIPLVLVLIFWKLSFFNCMVVFWALFGLIDVLTNGIPMKLQGLPNDAHNVMSLGKNPESLNAFWLQMKINEQIALGKRIKDLPEEWFLMPDEEGMQNPLSATIAVFACNRLVDAGKYEEAAKEMERVLNEKNAIIGIHKHMLNVDRIYCEMVGENRPEKLEELYTDELKKMMQVMKKSPSVHRTQYIYAKYVQMNEKMAKAAMEQFEKVAKTYPYPHEIAGERDMIAYAENKLAN